MVLKGLYVVAYSVIFRVWRSKLDYLCLKPYLDGNCFSSDFQHLQGVVGDFNAVQIQDVGVYLSPPP